MSSRTSARLLVAGLGASVALAGCGLSVDSDEQAGGATPTPTETAASAFCDSLGAVRDATYDLTASVDADLLRSTSERLDAALTEARGEAPEELSDELDTWFAEIADFQALLAEHDYDMESVPFEDWAEARVALDSPEVQRAQQGITEVAGEDCLSTDA